MIKAWLKRLIISANILLFAALVILAYTGLKWCRDYIIFDETDRWLHTQNEGTFENPLEYLNDTQDGVYWLIRSEYAEDEQSVEIITDYEVLKSNKDKVKMYNTFFAYQSTTSPTNSEVKLYKDGKLLLR
jgi:hypothetical protein